jgi:hypothetical protein
MYGVKDQYVHDAGNQVCVRLLSYALEPAIYDQSSQSQTAIASHLTILWAELASQALWQSNPAHERHLQAAQNPAYHNIYTHHSQLATSNLCRMGQTTLT